ncbi:hypothetical protein COLO4_34384 [Corchorus olitorius]|uniref:Uncharacterized protein n=1 Tax=Corchorus olitorius TaxID=93759 RepID=A0A1R3GL28_9ROSI|nr:hypothetical protein COLO4_34384 [Corchorus olitorius]
MNKGDLFPYQSSLLYSFFIPAKNFAFILLPGFVLCEFCLLCIGKEMLSWWPSTGEHIPYLTMNFIQALP